MNRYIRIITACTIGAVMTWWLNTSIGLGPAVASGLVGVIAALILPTELAVATYTASFAGMSSIAVLSGFSMALMAGILVGAIFAIALPVYQGFGGKLGTVAACASYVSMSANIRLRNTFETSIALLLAGLLFLVSTEIFVGVGGKLGTIAAISVMTVWGSTQALEAMPKLRQMRLVAKLYSRIF